jgi:adenylate cyclase
MIATISKLQPDRLGVIAPSSTMQYRRSAKAMDQIGRELGAEAALRGTLERNNGRVKVTATLLRTRDQGVIWTRTFERAIREIVAMQGELAGAVEQELAPVIPLQSAVSRPEPRTVEPEAHEAYLKGLYFWDKFTETGMKKSIEYMEEAAAKDVRFAAPYARMARGYGLLGNFSSLPPEQAYPRQKEFALKALALDSTSEEAHTALGWSELFYDRDWPAAKNSFETAVALNPNSAVAHQGFAAYFQSMGEFEQARPRSRKHKNSTPFPSISRRTSVGSYIVHAATRTPNPNCKRRSRWTRPSPSATFTFRTCTDPKGKEIWRWSRHRRRLRNSKRNRIASDLWATRMHSQAGVRLHTPYSTI